MVHTSTHTDGEHLGPHLQPGLICPIAMHPRGHLPLFYKIKGCKENSAESQRSESVLNFTQK